MHVYCDGNECRLVPRPKVKPPPLLEGADRPSTSPSNASADISRTLHETTAGECADQNEGGAVQCALGASGRERQPPSNGRESVRSLTKIASTYKESDSDGNDEMQRGE